jgi:tRNA (guanine-N7-)-methyltransferase
VARRLKHDIPGPDRRLSPDEMREKGLRALFAPDVAEPLPLVVELGFGRGEFLESLAADARDTAFLGVECVFRRVLKMARRLARSELANVRLVEARAEEVVELLPPESVASFWINFPDPWPKKRHHGRRLLKPPFVAELALRLIRGGELQVATDHVGYAEQIDRVLSHEPSLENALAPASFVAEIAGRRVTAYEAEWRAEGRPLHFWTYRRAT